MVFVGNWCYMEDFFIVLMDIDNNWVICEEKLVIKDLKVGDVVQIMFFIGVNYQIIDGLCVYVDYYYVDNLYVDWDIVSGIFDQVVKLFFYFLVDVGVFYNFDLGGFNCMICFNMNNVLDEIYIFEMDILIEDDFDIVVNEFYDNCGNFGFGCIWNVGLKVCF